MVYLVYTSYHIIASRPYTRIIRLPSNPTQGQSGECNGPLGEKMTKNGTHRMELGRVLTPSKPLGTLGME